MNKEEFINEFNDWTKEEILGRAFEICCKNIELKEIEKEHQRKNGCLHLEIKELKDRIDKAVEYIEKYTENIDRGKYYEDYVETYYLLKILKGDKE